MCQISLRYWVISEKWVFISLGWGFEICTHVTSSYDKLLYKKLLFPYKFFSLAWMAINGYPLMSVEYWNLILFLCCKVPLFMSIYFLCLSIPVFSTCLLVTIYLTGDKLILWSWHSPSLWLYHYLFSVES